MTKSLVQRCIVSAICLSLAACTETIIREVPASTPDPTGEAAEPNEPAVPNGSLGDGSNMVPVQQPDTPDNPTSLEDPVTPDTPDTPNEPSDPGTDPDPDTDSNPTPDPDPDAENPLADPSDEQTVGRPGETVNCDLTLPCKWVSADSQFTLSVTNADNIASRSRLAVNYSITTLHDTNVVVSKAGDAVDGAGATLKAADQVLGGGNGGTPQGLTAGGLVQGTINYNAGSASNTLEQWSISILEGGELRSASFSNIPVGTVTKAQADCQNTLPCVWTTPQEDVAITLQSVGGYLTNSRLNVNFSIKTSVDMPVAVDAGAKAVGIDGTAFEGRTHAFGIDVDYEKVSSSVTAGLPLYGSVNFFRTQQMPSSLQVLALVLYQDNPVPRWNPQFINVPVQ